MHLDCNANICYGRCHSGVWLSHLYDIFHNLPEHDTLYLIPVSKLTEAYSRIHFNTGIPLSLCLQHQASHLGLIYLYIDYNNGTHPYIIHLDMLNSESESQEIHFQVRICNHFHAYSLPLSYHIRKYHVTFHLRMHLDNIYNFSQFCWGFCNQLSWYRRYHLYSWCFYKEFRILHICSRKSQTYRCSWLQN